MSALFATSSLNPFASFPINKAQSFVSVPELYNSPLKCRAYLSGPRTRQRDNNSGNTPRLRRRHRYVKRGRDGAFRKRSGSPRRRRLKTFKNQLHSRQGRSAGGKPAKDVPCHGKGYKSYLNQALRQTAQHAHASVHDSRKADRDS